MLETGILWQVWTEEGTNNVTYTVVNNCPNTMLLTMLYEGFLCDKDSKLEQTVMKASTKWNQHRAVKSGSMCTS